MNLSKLTEKMRRVRSLCIAPLLIAMAFNLAVMGCGEFDQNSTDVQTMMENDGPPCPGVDWGYFPIVNVGAIIDVDAPSGMQVRTAIMSGLHDAPPSDLTDTTELAFEYEGVHTIFVVADGDGCSATVTRRVVEVVSEFPSRNGVDKEDPRIQGWASSWLMPVQYGEAVVEMWQTPERAMGPASGQAGDIVSLGAGGQIELFFDGELYNGDGVDFAVFENSFSPTFLELGFVEVSSDGIHFVQFPTIYLGTNTISPFQTHRPEIMYGFAGRFPTGVGTPFDLEDLKFETEVRSGLVDLDRITSVRILDVIGDGNTLDSMGHPIFDPYPTAGSAGFDLEAVGVMHLNETQQPSETQASR